MDYEIIQINQNTWRIEDQGVRFFLLAGTKKALLIDSGMQINNAKDIAQSLTHLPIELFNTHADKDHIGSNQQFDHFYMNPAECSNYYNTQKATGTIIPVEDGDIIDLGERPLKIIALPGHTPGSTALLDIHHKVLISGDPIQDGMIFMFGVQREMHAYLHSLLKIKKYTDQFDTIYPSHGSFPVKPSLIDELIFATQKIMNGDIIPEDISFHGIPLKKYNAHVASFLCDQDFTK